VQLNDQLDIDGGKGGSEVRKYKTFYLWLEFNIFYETQPLGVPGQPLKVSKRRVLPPIPQVQQQKYQLFIKPAWALYFTFVIYLVTSSLLI